MRATGSHAHPSGCYIATWVPASHSRSLAAGIEAAALVAGSGVSIGRVVDAFGGDPLVPWADGSLTLVEIDTTTGLDRTRSAELGLALARVHRATVAHQVSSAMSWHWLDPHAEHLLVDPVVQALVADAVRRVQGLPALVEGVCHGDPFPGSFLTGPEAGVTLVDWTAPTNGPLLYDVASVAMYLGGPDAAAGFLAAYAEARGPATRDLDHLNALLRFRWAVQANHFSRRIADRDLDGTTLDDDDVERLGHARRRLMGWY